MAGSHREAQTDTQPLRLSPGGRIAGRYRIIDEAGRGGMAVVYRAHDERLNRTVAVKVPAGDEAARRLAREAEIAARVDSPHVVPVYDYAADDGLQAIVMPYFDTTLAGALHDRNHLPPDEALEVARQVAEALHAAHEAGVVHGDVKPSNVFLRGGRAFLGDFGASPAGGDTGTGRGFFGTPAYLAPEQVEHGRTEPASDLYALGLVLYQALAGRLPFDGDGSEAVARARLTQAPDPPGRHRAGIPPAVDRLVMRALARDPADRFPDARSLADALAAARPTPGTADAPTERVTPDTGATQPITPVQAAEPDRPADTGRAAAPWAGLAVAGLGLLGGVLLLQQGPTRAAGVFALAAGAAVLAAVARKLLRAYADGTPVRRRRRDAAGGLAAVDWETAARALLGGGLTFLAVHAWLSHLPGYAAWDAQSSVPAPGPTAIALAAGLGVAIGAFRARGLRPPQWRAASWLFRLSAVGAFALIGLAAVWPLPGLAAAALALGLGGLVATRRYGFAVALLAAAAWLPWAPAFVVPVLLALLGRSLFVSPWVAGTLVLALLFAAFSGGPAGSLAAMGLVDAPGAGVQALAAPPSLSWLGDQIDLMQAAPGTFWSDQARALGDALAGTDYLALLWYGTVWWIAAAVAQPRASRLGMNVARLLVALALSAAGHALGAGWFGTGTGVDAYAAASALALGLLWLAVLRPRPAPTAVLEPEPQPAV